MSLTRSQTIASLIQAEETFATSLTACCIQLFGTEFFSWDPETISMELTERFRDIPQVNIDKVLAMVTALTTDQFYIDPIVFFNTASVFSGQGILWTSLFGNELDVEDYVWAASEIGLNDIPNKKDPVPTFSGDVASLMGLKLREVGFIRPPKLAAWAIMPDLTSLDPESLEMAERRQLELDTELTAAIHQKLQQLDDELAKLPFRESKGLLPPDSAVQTVLQARNQSNNPSKFRSR